MSKQASNGSGADGTHCVSMKMKSFIKTLVPVGFFVGVGVLSSFANAASFSAPGGVFSSQTGPVTFKAPSTSNSPVTCSVYVQGDVDGAGVANIRMATFVGSNPVCQRMSGSNFPWTMTATGSIEVKVNRFQFRISGTPTSACGPANLSGIWVAQGSRLIMNNQSTSGLCSIVSLDIPIPQLTFNP